MKVLSLLQPWATLVVIGAKKIETRSWNTKYRGDILIHASKNKKIAEEIIYKFPFNKVMVEYFNHDTEPYIEDLPFGAIIGKVNICTTSAVETLPQINGQELVIRGGEYNGKIWKMTEQEIAFGDYSPGRYAWLLSDPIKFEKPIPCKGSLSLWDCPEDVFQQIPQLMTTKI